MTRRVIDEDVWFDWEYGRCALQWCIRLADWSEAWGKIRVHDNGPGPDDWHCNVDVWVRSGTYQMTGFITLRKGSPIRQEHWALKRYLKSLGLKEKKRKRVREYRAYLKPMSPQ